MTDSQKKKKPPQLEVNETDTVHHPHDALFTAAMQNHRASCDFLTAYVPPEIVRRMVFSTVVIDKNSYIDKRHKRHFLDVLFRVNLKSGEEVCIFCLVEQQTKPDRLMPFRVIQSICHATDQLIAGKKGVKKIPFIFPIVFYNGKKRYPYTTAIQDIVNAPRDWVEKYFLKNFHLVDLSQIPDEEIKKHAWAGVMEFVMKHIYARDMLPYVRAIAPLLQQIIEEGGKDYVHHVLYYVIRRGEIQDKDAFLKLIQEHISQEVGVSVMSLAAQWLAEGMEKGIEKGIEKGKEEVALRMSSKGVSMDLIVEATGLTHAEIIRLKQTVH